jgi:hypothetical protein
VALVRLDRLAAARAQEVPVTCNGAPVAIAPPQGVRFSPEAAGAGAA